MDPVNLTVAQTEALTDRAAQIYQYTCEDWIASDPVLYAHIRELAGNPKLQECIYLKDTPVDPADWADAGVTAGDIEDYKLVELWVVYLTAPEVENLQQPPADFVVKILCSIDEDEDFCVLQWNPALSGEQGGGT